MSIRKEDAEIAANRLRHAQEEGWTGTDRDERLGGSPSLSCTQDGAEWTLELSAVERRLVVHQGGEEPTRREVRIPGWTFSAVWGAIEGVTVAHGLPEVSMAMLSMVFVALGW